jgi:hypothetical protein
MVIYPVAGNMQSLRLPAQVPKNFCQPVPKHYKFFIGHFLTAKFANLDGQWSMVKNPKSKIENQKS